VRCRTSFEAVTSERFQQSTLYLPISLLLTVCHFSPFGAKNDRQKRKVPCCRKLKLPFA
jgi:hypothetical protein